MNAIGGIYRSGADGSMINVQHSCILKYNLKNCNIIQNQIVTFNAASGSDNHCHLHPSYVTLSVSVSTIV